MLINLSDVLSEQHKTVDETVQLEMDTFQSRTGTFPIVSKEPVHVVAEHVKGRELLIHVDTELCILIPCDRCLEDVKQEFDLNFTKHVDLNVSDADLGEGLDESNFISGYILQLCMRILPLRSALSYRLPERHLSDHGNRWKVRRTVRILQNPCSKSS